MNLTVASSPHIRGDFKTSRIMLDVVLALMPALIVGVIVLGIRAAVVTLISVAAAVAEVKACCKAVIIQRINPVGEFLRSRARADYDLLCLGIALPHVFKRDLYAEVACKRNERFVILNVELVDLILVTEIGHPMEGMNDRDLYAHHSADLERLLDARLCDIFADIFISPSK